MFQNAKMFSEVQLYMYSSETFSCFQQNRIHSYLVAYVSSCVAAIVFWTSNIAHVVYLTSVTLASNYM